MVGSLVVLFLVEKYRKSKSSHLIFIPFLGHGGSSCPEHNAPALLWCVCFRGASFSAHSKSKRLQIRVE